MIHVCYGLNDKTGYYSKFTGTSMLSLFENISAAPPSVTVHILHDNTLSQANYEKFVYIAGKYGQIVKFHNVEKLCVDKLKFLWEKLNSVFNSRFSAGTFYRLMVDKKFFQPDDVSKIIYLDADTIINMDIAELWNYPMNGATLAAVPELQATRGYMITNKHLLYTDQVKIANYFCAGIIMLDLEKFDSDFFYKGVQWLAENPKCECFDQDILNYFFTDSYCKLPEKFDSFVGVSKSLDKNVLYKKIYHYAGWALGLDMKNAHDKLFFDNFVKTPWFSADFIENIHQIIRQIYIEQKNFAVQTSAAISGKERAFFITPNDIETVKKVFKITENEEIIVADSQASIEKLYAAMRNCGGKKIYFIVITNPTVTQALTQQGFIEGKDFINAIPYLTDAYGVPIPIQNIVRYL